MQREKNIRRLAVLILLVLAAIVLHVFMNRSRRPVPQDIFRPRDVGAIDNIRLVGRTDTVNLSFNGAQWTLNDSLVADANMITVLFATLQQEIPRQPVSEVQRDSVANFLLDEGVRVELRSTDHIELEFYAGGNPQKTRSYFMDTQTRESYLVTIPGYRVYVSGIFEQPAESWRNRRIFDFNWRNFEELQVRYPAEPASDFSVTMTSGTSYVLDGNIQADTARMNEFLDRVSLITASRFLTRQEGQLDSVLNTIPRFQIIVRDVAGGRHDLAVYGDQEGGGQVLVRINGATPALVARDDVDQVRKSRSYFVMAGDEKN